MGIGTSSPTSKLHVYVANNGLNIVGGFQNGNGTETGGNAVGVGFVNEALGNWWKAAIVHERQGPYGVGSLKFLVNNTTDNSSVSFADTKMTILASGFVGIGMATPREELSVNGSIRAKQIKVETANWPDYVFKPTYQLPSLTGVKTYIDQNQHLPAVKLNNVWPDYVFKPTYQLPSLTEVKTYIDQNKHLPEIPSEQEIAKEGQNLGEMNKLLLKKVEELTLYLIENDRKDIEREAKKDRRLNKLERKVTELQKKLGVGAPKQ